MSESAASHRREAQQNDRTRSIRCAVLTVSDTRTLETDASGQRIEAMLVEAGHVAVERRLVPDEPDQIQDALGVWLADASVRVVLTTGGTGIGRRDTTIEVVRRLLTTELEGFGELFRAISYAEIGAAAMLSRAVAGLVAREDEQGGDTFVFAMPGSPNAVETAMNKLVLPELPHLVWART